MQTIKAEELKNLSAGSLLLDVRTPGEFRRFHVRGAVNLPLDSLSSEKVKAVAEGRPIYILCQSGARAKSAAERLLSAGVTELTVVEGGSLACRLCGIEIEENDAGTIPLERQVRIAAGVLVVIGVLLGYLFAPAFYLLAAFVGGGLIFSGITDTCAMSSVLAKMPWNE